MNLLRAQKRRDQLALVAPLLLYLTGGLVVALDAVGQFDLPDDKEHLFLIFLGFAVALQLVAFHLQHLDLQEDVRKRLESAVPIRWLHDWSELYEEATRLVKTAERAVRATDFGGGGGSKNAERYLQALANRGYEQAQRRGFRYRSLVATTTAADNKGVERRQEAVARRREAFNKAGIGNHCEIRHMEDPGFGIDVLLIDSRHAVLAFHKLGSTELEQGLAVSDMDPKGNESLVSGLVAWFDNLYDRADRDDADQPAQGTRH